MPLKLGIDRRHSFLIYQEPQRRYSLTNGQSKRLAEHLLRAECSDLGDAATVNFNLLGNDADPALCDQPQGVRVEPMLDREDSCRQALLVVVGMNGNDRLADDRSGIELGADEMNRATREADARCKGLTLGVEAAEGRKEGRMDIDHPIAPGFDKTRLQHPHEAGQADQLDPPLTEQYFGVGRKGRPIAVRDDPSGYAGRGRNPEPRRLGTIADNEDDLRRVRWIAARLDQCLQVRAATRYQHSNSQPPHRRARAVEQYAG
jgi:hypothetical protein